MLQFSAKEVVSVPQQYDKSVCKLGWMFTFDLSYQNKTQVVKSHSFPTSE